VFLTENFKFNFKTFILTAHTFFLKGIVQTELGKNIVHKKLFNIQMLWQALKFAF